MDHLFFKACTVWVA